MEEQNKLLSQRRPCSVWNSEMTETEFAWFHMWFTPTEDGWPKALVELVDGRMICVGFRKIIFDQDHFQMQ